VARAKFKQPLELVNNLSVEIQKLVDELRVTEGSLTAFLRKVEDLETTHYYSMGVEGAQLFRPIYKSIRQLGLTLPVGMTVTEWRLAEIERKTKNHFSKTK